MIIHALKLLAQTFVNFGMPPDNIWALPRIRTGKGSFPDIWDAAAWLGEVKGRKRQFSSLVPYMLH